MSGKLLSSTKIESAESNAQDSSLIDPSYWWQIVIAIARQLAWTVCAALFVPVALWILIWQLQPAGDPALLRGALVHGLQAIVPYMLVALFLAKSLQPEGIAEKVFGWTPLVCDGLLHSIRSLIWFVLPLTGAQRFLSVYALGAYHDSLGRLALMISMATLALGLWRTGTSLVRWNQTRAPGARQFWIADGHLFRILATGVPLILVLLTAIGYRYVADQLSQRLCWTFLAAVAILLLSGLIHRLAMGNQRRLERRLSLSENSQRQYMEELTQYSRQVVRLIQTGTCFALAMMVWNIWAEILRWQGQLDQVRLWQRESKLANALLPETAVEWVTLFHLGWAGMVFCLAIVISKNLPGLLELAIPARVPLDKGGRYAISFVMRYFVLLVGLVQAAGILGFAWDRVQWLAAGLTVGLGFGLQEIFANLISGIIILIERPARVGDFVSVNSVTGTITKMALRATTLMDSDRREWIIPNKKFITENLMNWTLSDTVARIVIPISVLHGSDPEQVRQLLTSLGRSHPDVMKHPEPSTILAKFGTYSLDFELRVFVANRSVYGKVQNELLLAIERSCKRQGVELFMPWKTETEDEDKEVAQDEPTGTSNAAEIGATELDPNTIPEVVFIKKAA